jgi:hypothetical protein
MLSSSDRFVALISIILIPKYLPGATELANIIAPVDVE